jgi:hypothetical protein
LTGIELMRSTWISEKIHRGDGIPLLRESIEKFLGKEPKAGPSLRMILIVSWDRCTKTPRLRLTTIWDVKSRRLQRGNHQR